jgi:hypothetical protein
MRVYTVDSKPFGLSYREWTAKWWQWLISIPVSKNPATDQSGQNSYQNQVNNYVWFLAGTAKPYRSAKRRCNISSSKAILFPIITTVVSYLENPLLKDENDLMRSASEDIARWTLLDVEINGRKLKDLQRYQVMSGPFQLRYPEDNLFGSTPGITTAVSDGFWVFLPSLHPGKNVIYFHGAEPNFENEVWYELTTI